MADQPDPADAAPALRALKLVEPQVDTDDPWSDDVLDRKEIADRLTSIVRRQAVPFVISLDGRWGTGKTFLLKRWAQDLRNEDPKWQAIYYNAWEDDFAGDPLLSITGQLSEHFEKTTLADRARQLGSLIRPLLRFGASTAAVATTGVPLPNLPEGQQPPSDSLASYLAKRAAKDKLKESLGELAAEVRKETDQPLAFIIDELDRCRPTFAIELLERVKHIFDVSNIVFVFGINRSELAKALESTYGQIDAGTYLRRFFDMEFVLPDPDPRAFCENLFARYGLDAFLASQSARGSDNLPGATHVVPFVLGTMGLSLRDMDYCMRLLSLAARDSQAELAPTLELFGTLVALKITNQELYRDYVSGIARGADVINYINARSRSRAGSPDTGYLEGPDIERMEAALYAADWRGGVEGQVVSLLDGRSLSHPESLAPHHRQLSAASPEGRSKLEHLRNWIRSFSDKNPRMVATGLAQTIDLHHGSIRR